MITKLPTQKVSQTLVNHVEAGRRIRVLRESKNLSLRRFSSLMGFTPAFISDLERGRRNWTNAHFEKAVSILNEQ